MIDCRRTCCTLLLTALMLGACTARAPRPPAEAPPAPAGPSEADVELFLQTGDVLGAAGVYAMLAERAQSPEREDYLLRAVALLLEHEQYAAAGERLAQLPSAGLTPPQTWRRALLTGRLALATGDPAKALAQLPTEQPEMTLAERAALLQVRADALGALERIDEA